MKRLFLPLAFAAPLGACTVDTPGPAAVVPAELAWRSIATDFDRDRVRRWRNAWVRALAQADGKHRAEIAAEGALLQPDSALRGVDLPAGGYRCRTIKIGGHSEGMLDYVTYPAFDCRISGGAGAMDFVKLTGSQRPVGRLFADNDRRMIFLGTMQLGDEKGTLRYGHDRQRDMIAIVERVGERRWRLVFPWPAYESNLDVIELLPKE